ncbi:MAG: hypothetical protein E7396_03135 [Ruminococcaceae bacterium]|nr:hypothetical protein [Oscillospiraceae bacterium]
MSKISVIGLCGKSTFMYVDHFHQKGETIEAESVYSEIGGKGSNQAIAAKRMGASVSFLAAIGDDETGQECKRVYEENGVNAFLVTKKGKITPFAFILKDKHGENLVTEYGTAVLEADDVISFEEEIASSDILLIGHEVPDEVNEKAVSIAKKYGIKIILNPAPARNIPDFIAENTYIVTPNEHESKFVNREKIKLLITTLGSKGCSINDSDFVPAMSVKAEDTTGAGDTFNGVLSVCIAEGMDIKKACRMAVKASGISVSRRYVLNAIPYRNEIEGDLNNE